MKSIHRKGLSWTCLSISKTCDNSSLQQTWKQWFQSCLVNIISRLFLIECIIKSKSMVLNVFGNPIHFIFWLVYFDLGICCRDCINLSIDFLLFENGTLSDVNCKFSLTVGLVRRKKTFFEFAFLYHELEVDIYIFTGSNIDGFFLLFFFFGFFHFQSSLFSFLLNFFDAFHS